MRTRSILLLSSQVFTVLVVAAVLGFVTNSARKDGLPLVMPFPPEYRCRSASGAATPIETAAAKAVFGRRGTIFVDARTREEFARGHIEGAVNVPYLLVEPVPPSAVSSLKGYERVIVYCNTKDGELSRLMAGELSEAGLKEVSYLSKGFRGWAEAGGKHTGEKPPGYEALR
jgi:rhodanese-related sulfurtransferase